MIISSHSARSSSMPDKNTPRSKIKEKLLAISIRRCADSVSTRVRSRNDMSAEISLSIGSCGQSFVQIYGNIRWVVRVPSATFKSFLENNRMPGIVTSVLHNLNSTILWIDEGKEESAEHKELWGVSHGVRTVWSNNNNFPVPKRNSWEFSFPIWT